jgi:hypothetical protein
MKKIFLIITYFFCYFFALAQQPVYEQRKEQLETEKINFFTEKIGLTLEQNPKFWTLYNNFKKQEGELRKKEMLLRKKGANITQETEFAVIVKDLLAVEKERFDLTIEFRKDIEKILSPKQMFLFFDAEKQYKSLLLKKINNAGGSQHKRQK